MPNQYTERAAVEERFWSKVDKSGECWLWTAGTFQGRYGAFWIQFGLTELAHRQSYIMEHGDIPGGMFVLHKCDNGLCVRPDHLFLGTARDNTQDMFQKGRGWIGKTYNNKLSRAEAILIRLLLGEGVSSSDIAPLFNISRQAVNDIAARRTWRNLSSAPAA